METNTMNNDEPTLPFDDDSDHEEHREVEDEEQTRSGIQGAGTG